MPTAADSVQVEQVLDDLIARLSKAAQTKSNRIALIEARRLRNLTARWASIPPPEDARREFLTKVMDLVAIARGEKLALGSPAPSVSGAHAAVRRALPTPFPAAPIDPVSTAGAPIPVLEHPPTDLKSGNVEPPDSGRVARRSPSGHELIPEPDWANLARRKFSPFPSVPPPDSHRRAPTSRSSPLLASAQPKIELEMPSGSAPPSSGPPHSRTTGAGTHRVPSIPPPAAPMPSVPPPVSNVARGSGVSSIPGVGRQLRAKIADGITLVRPDAAPWRPYPNAEGVSLKLLFRDPVVGGYTALVKLDAGAELPSHRHAADEEMYVVEGVAMVGEDEMCSGDYCRAAAGSVHGTIKSAVGCMLYLKGSEHDEVL